MVYYKNKTWHLCNEKVRYIQRDEEIEQYVGAEGHDWWINFEHEHTEIIEFIPFETTQEQIDRLGEINQLNIPDGFGAELSDYVEFGTFPDGFNHVLRPIQIKHEQVNQDKYLVDQDFRLSLMEMGV